MNLSMFVHIARAIPIPDPEVQEVWERLLTAVEDGRACTPELMLEMLKTLEGVSGRVGFNELTLDEAEGDPTRAELYYLLFGHDSITCSKEGLLKAYQQLLKALEEGTM